MLTLPKKISFFDLRDKAENFLFILPALAIFAVFYIYPFYEIFNLSMREWDGIGLTKTFIGLENFRELMRDRIWWSSMWHAAYITLIALTFQNMLAFALALACDREIRMKGAYRVIFFLPPVLSEVVVGLVWQWLLASGKHGGEHIGLLNHVLHNLGLHHMIHSWLSDPKTALTCVAVIHAWKGFGWGFILFLAGLQTIDRQLYEAARVDGANSWRMFRNVTIPMMMPVIAVVIILTILGSMQAFVLIIAMTGGGPGYHTEVPVTRILGVMTSGNRFGYACSMGVLFGLILITVSFALKTLSNRMKQV